MDVIESIVKNESVEDVLKVFALNSGIPSLDIMFGRYRHEVRASGELINTYQRLFDEGVLQSGPNGVAVKGPNWIEPKFLADNKYGKAN